jgi:putative alpha-1,2-mannosidase
VNKDRTLLFYVSHALLEKDGCRGSEVNIDRTNQEVSGWMISSGSLTRRIVGGVKIYFSAKFNELFNQYGTWNGVNTFPNTNYNNGTSIGAYLTFSSRINKIESKVAISFISVEQARINLKHDAENKNFETVLRESEVNF